MPATPARIGFIQQQYRSAVVEDQSVKNAYGSMARKTEDPMPTFFDNVADAQIMAEQRQELLGALRRRRFRITITGIGEVQALDYTGGSCPTVRHVDRERGIDAQMLVAEMAWDLGRQRSILTIWG